MRAGAEQELLLLAALPRLNPNPLAEPRSGHSVDSSSPNRLHKRISSIENPNVNDYFSLPKTTPLEFACQRLVWVIVSSKSTTVGLVRRGKTAGVSRRSPEAVASRKPRRWADASRAISVFDIIELPFQSHGVLFSRGTSNCDCLSAGEVFMPDLAGTPGEPAPDLLVIIDLDWQ
jgi:hypothetical protein